MGDYESEVEAKRTTELIRRLGEAEARVAFLRSELVSLRHMFITTTLLFVIVFAFMLVMLWQLRH